MAEYVEDRTESFLGGQDAFIHPDNIKEDQYASGINVSTRAAVITPRFGYERFELDFGKEGFHNKGGYFISWRKLFSQGKFQAFIPYQNGGDVYVLIVISGYIYRINVNTRKATVLNVEGPKPNQYKARLNWTFANQYIVLFDYPNNPILIDGTDVRRADPDNEVNGISAPEVPPAELGTFNQSRLFVGSEGNEFTGGDPVGNSLVDPPITFAEVLGTSATFPGQAFQLGTEYQNQEITSMGFLQQTDTSTGIGPLIVATNNSIHAYPTNTPRANWTKGEFGKCIVYESGIAGPRARVNVNSDLWFLSADGQVRSLSMSRDEQAKWSRTPISNEVHNWLKYWDKSLTKFAVLGYFKNKIFITANPFRVEALDREQKLVIDYANAGVVVLEMDNFSRLGQAAPPAWAGLWLGVRPMDMCVTPDDRCFVISKDANSVNRLYQMRPDLSYDLVKGKPQYIRSRIYTREYTCKDAVTFKENYTVDLTLEEIQGDFKLNVERRPSHTSKFLPWRKWGVNVPWRACKTIPLRPFAALSPRELSLGTPEGSINECDPVTEDTFNIFRKQQLRLTMTGKFWALTMVRLVGEVKPNLSKINSCDELPTVEQFKECDDDWTLGDDDGCDNPTT